MEFRVKKTAGKTWATLKDGDLVDEAFLKKIGVLLVESIVFEAGKDFAKQGNTPTPRGQPEGIPKSLRFFDSFSYKVTGGKTVEIYTDWDDQLNARYDAKITPKNSVARAIMDGKRRDPFEMKGVTRPAWKRVMMVNGGSMVYRQAPGVITTGKYAGTTSPLWIHPGFAKHTFIRRGYDRARRRMDKLIKEQVVKVLSGMNVV
jgi:hypothetical protein